MNPELSLPKGDEEAVKAFYPRARWIQEAGAVFTHQNFHDMWINPIGLGNHDEAWADARSKLPKPEDETTLSATEVSQPKRPPIFHREIYTGGIIHAVAVYRKSESDSLFTALEAERDALKAENRQLAIDASWARVHRSKHADCEDALRKSESDLVAMTEDRNLWQDAHNEDCPNKAHLDALKADNMHYLCDLSSFRAKVDALKIELNFFHRQLDAVVGQETPQDAWARGFDEGIGAAIRQVEISVQLHPRTKLETIVLEAPPYTPPLKAGQ